MGFAAPWLLAGLAVLALPVLIHLVRRQERNRVAFPSLMFLRDIPYKERRRRTLRDRLLLLLRCLLLALLVLAFAGPFIQVAGDSAVGRDRVLLLDRSLSMRHGERWTAAMDAAEQALAETGPQDRAALLLFDRGVSVAAELGAEPEALRAALSAAEPGYERTDFAQALQQAQRQLADGRGGVRREVVLISDFQRAGHDPENIYRLPAGTELNPVPIGVTSEPAANVALADLRLAAVGADELRVELELRRFGEMPPAPFELSLEVDDREPQRRSVTAEDEFETVSFTLPPPVEGWLAARFAVTGIDRLAEDDHFYWRLTAPPRLSVLVIEGAGARARQSLYLRRALELGRRPAFSVEVKSLAELDQADFAERAVVVVNDAPLPGGELGARLRRFVDAGGGLLVAAGDGLQGGWPGGADGYLPGNLGVRLERQAGNARASLNRLDLDHPALAGLDDPAGLSAARVFRYRELRRGTDDRLLGSYDDGRPALLERRVGAGRVIVLSTTLDTHWNDLPLASLYPPLVQNLLSYLAGFEPTPAWFGVGQVVDLAAYARAQPGATGLAAALAGGGSAVLETPSGVSRSVTRDPPLTLTEPGFYRLRRDPAAVLLAANVDPAESDLTPLDVAAFVAAVSEPTDADARQTAPGAEAPHAVSALPLWRYLLFAVLALLAAELFWSNRRRTPSQEPVNG